MLGRHRVTLGARCQHEVVLHRRRFSHRSLSAFIYIDGGLRHLRLAGLGQVAPPNGANDRRSSLFEATASIELLDVGEYVGHLFTGSALATDPRVTHDSVSV